jgi:DNA-binding NarL/FixJ family response regulator
VATTTPTHRNRQIVRELQITEKTVGTHVEDNFDRLGFQSRAPVAAWVGMGAPDARSAPGVAA